MARVGLGDRRGGRRHPQVRTENYWRKHGIATASAALRGGWVAAGANFEGRLPNENVDILASHCVPKEHLDQGNSRKTHDSKPVCDYELGNGDVRVRVFEFGS